MAVERKVDFAKRLGVNKATVTRWEQAHRLVLDASGKVRIEESLRLLDETRGSRDDNAYRAELDRMLKADIAMMDAAQPPEQRMTEKLRDDLRRAALEKAISEARIKKAEADLREMERDRQAGVLILREDVDFVLNDFGAMLRSMLDGRAERLGAELGLAQEQILAVSESDEHLLAELADKLKERAA